jgi:hypothetical protein
MVYLTTISVCEATGNKRMKSVVCFLIIFSIRHSWLTARLEIYVSAPSHWSWCKAAVLNLASVDWKWMSGNTTTLCSLTRYWHAAFHSILKVGYKVIYGLYTPKMSVNFNSSQYFYFMRLNTFIWEGVRRFQPTLKAVRGTKGIQKHNSVTKKAFNGN